MKGMISVALIFAWGLLCVGCGSASSDWVGTWEGERTGLTVPGKEDGIARALRKVSITIKPDGTFDKVEASIPSTGTVRYEDGKAYLKQTKIMDKPAEADPNVARQNKELILEKTADGKVLYWDIASLVPGSVEMNRASAGSKR